jgi:GT2 family glycosyltransferase
MPLISVIIPCFVATERQAELLEETLATVSAQTGPDYEVIVVDDGSPVDVARIASKHRGTMTIRQTNAGSAAARNTGIARSRGQYLVFLDADDYLLPGSLQTGLDVFSAHPDCGFVVGPREEMTYEGEAVAWAVPVPPPQSDLYNALLGFDWYIIPPSSAMFRCEVVEAVGGFQDPWGADDLDFYLRVSRTYLAWCYQSPPVTRYRRYSASSSRDGERMLHSVRAVYARQLPLVQGNAESEVAFRRGLHQLTEIFLDCAVENLEDRIRSGDHEGALRSAGLLSSESPQRLAAAVARLGDAGECLLAEIAERRELTPISGALGDRTHRMPPQQHHRCDERDDQHRKQRELD